LVALRVHLVVGYQVAILRWQGATIKWIKRKDTGKRV